MMRHTDIRVTMNTYGTVFDEAVNSAGLKVAELASIQTEHKQRANPANLLKRWWAL